VKWIRKKIPKKQSLKWIRMLKKRSPNLNWSSHPHNARPHTSHATTVEMPQSVRSIRPYSVVPTL